MVGWRNRAFLTAAVRADDSSAFGVDFDAAIYPKLSGTWVVSEEVVLAHAFRAAVSCAGPGALRAGSRTHLQPAVCTNQPSVTKTNRHWSPVHLATRCPEAGAGVKSWSSVSTRVFW